MPADTSLDENAARAPGISRPPSIPRPEERGVDLERKGERHDSPFESSHQAPFKAYLSNIPYDLDEDSVARFFSGLQVLVQVVDHLLVTLTAVFNVYMFTP